MEKENQSRIDKMIGETMKNINELIDVNTVIGDPVNTPLGVVIPVCNVGMGFLSGGGEYGQIKYYKKGEEFPFSGGTGAIVSVKPMGFLVDNGLGYKVVPMASDFYDKILNACESLINSLNKDE